MDCNCPEPTALTSIPVENCVVNMKQIQKLGFQRLQSTPFFDATTVIDLAEWQTALTATDDTKIVVTPLIGGDPIIEAGDAITSGGGDNSTLNGVEENEGTNPSAFSALFKGLSAVTEKALKALMCEPRLTVFFFLQGGKIAVLNTGDGTPVGKTGFPLQGTPFISDRNNAGFATKDTHNISFSLAPGWSEDLEIISPDFNPLTDL
jgi:hypothetical protein